MRIWKVLLQSWSIFNNQNSLNFHNDVFFTMLPYPWSDLIFTRWKATEQPARSDALGARIEFAIVTFDTSVRKHSKDASFRKIKNSLNAKTKCISLANVVVIRISLKRKRNLRLRRKRVSRLKNQRSFLRRRKNCLKKKTKRKQQNLRQSRFRNRIGDVGTAIKNVTLPMNVQNKYIFSVLTLTSCLSKLHDTKKYH